MPTLGRNRRDRPVAVADWREIIDWVLGLRYWYWGF